MMRNYERKNTKNNRDPYTTCQIKLKTLNVIMTLSKLQVKKKKKNPVVLVKYYELRSIYDPRIAAMGWCMCHKLH